jgi:hypothetical protein
MALDPQIQKMLNKFANTQPALQIPDQPVAFANPMLGDLLAAALNTLSAAQDGTYTYSVAVAGPGNYSLGSMNIPAGAIITEVLTDVTTALASSGSATLAIATGTAGADTLVAAQAYSAYTGTQKQTLSATVVKTAGGGPLILKIAAAALTAGVMRVIVSWKSPDSDLGQPQEAIGIQDVAPTTGDLI